MEWLERTKHEKMVGGSEFDVGLSSLLYIYSTSHPTLKWVSNPLKPLIYGFEPRAP